MHKYDIENSDWNQNIDILYSKVELYINRLMNINHKCTGSVIRELCETRDIVWYGNVLFDIIEYAMPENRF